MKNYLKWFENDPAVVTLNNHIEGLSNLTENEEGIILASSFTFKKRPMVVIKNNLYSAQQLYNRLYPLLQEDVLLFAMEESLRVEQLAATPTMYASQMETLAKICLDEKPYLIITHPAAITRYIPTKEIFKSKLINLKTNQKSEIKILKEILQSAGYKQVNRIDQPLTFALRGSIIDVFSIQYENPIRIEFFDDEIDSIRFFDINTQRTIEVINQITIVPASLLIYDEDFNEVRKKVNLQLKEDILKSDYPIELQAQINLDLDYLEKGIYEHYLYRYYSFFEKTAHFLSYINNPDVILSTIDGININIDNYTKENIAFLQEQFNQGKFIRHYEVNGNFLREVLKYKPYYIQTFTDMLHPVKSKLQQIFYPIQPLDMIVKDINKKVETKNVYLSVSTSQQESLETLVDQRVHFIKDVFVEGFEYDDNLVLTNKELFGIKTHNTKFTSKFNKAIVLDDYQDLKLGDYVVHNQYGIGQYQGIVQKTYRGITKDYLNIVYKDDDLLLVPLEQFKQVRKYVGSEAVNVHLSKLGSASWNKTKERIKEDVNQITERLITLYSAREQEIGFQYGKDDDNMRMFEAQRAFELTDDQKVAINEVKTDMESTKPMDRLICGDVGFGKTEVAMVAAFKAICNAKQVAYLCPTTILSRQHYNTFKERFRGFPVKIALLNRFVPPSEQNQIIEDTKAGKIDILIGTHRLLSKDIKFEDLGLLIIDEEQRFGVAAKEAIKELKQSVDALSLSATPIPRTLQMSLMGVMSLSLINTAPKDRMPVQTYVVERNESLIKEVIQRELARNGQVFYLHNNIKNIYELVRKIETMIPNCKVAVAHGKMDRDQIEEVMYRFVSGEYDVLVCTTIIETGIDIPNVNTIVIDDADMFGLAQLYQIRGRVGRSDRIAYAYLMYHQQRQLSEIATKRLQAIKEFTELGSGYKIAMRDLTIRGAGDILGDKQAGFINSVGMDLYLDLLQEAIDEKKGIVHQDVETKKINEVDNYIPIDFSIDYEKLNLYQRIEKVSTLASLTQLKDEIVDRFGKLPNQVNLLFSKKQVELMLESNKFEKFDEFEKECRLTLSKEYCDSLDGVKFFEGINKISSDIKLKYFSGCIILSIIKKKNWLEILNRVVNFVEDGIYEIR